MAWDGCPVGIFIQSLHGTKIGARRAIARYKTPGHRDRCFVTTPAEARRLDAAVVAASKTQIITTRFELIPMPTNVRLVYDDGVVPVDCVYDGIDDDGIHIWQAIVHGRVPPGVELRFDELPAHCGIEMVVVLLEADADR